MTGVGKFQFHGDMQGTYVERAWSFCTLFFVFLEGCFKAIVVFSDFTSLVLLYIQMVWNRILSVNQID